VELKDDLLSLVSESSPHATIRTEKSRIKGLVANCIRLDTLGRSPYGVTYLVKNKDDGSLHVIKKPHRSTQAVREAQLLSRLNHPGILKTLSACTDDGNGIIVTEYAKGGSLADRLVVSFSPVEAMRIFKQIAGAVSYAHEHGIIHGNLRPSNILFDADGNVKVTGFGLPEHRSRFGENWYCPPEDGRSQAADIYAAGVILHQLLTRRLPVMNNQGDLNWITKSPDRRFTLLNLLSRMLEKDPDLRPPSFRWLIHQIAAFEKVTSSRKDSKPAADTLVCKTAKRTHAD
jgi:serine/threonine protein kinase